MNSSSGQDGSSTRPNLSLHARANRPPALHIPGIRHEDSQDHPQSSFDSMRASFPQEMEGRQSIDGTVSPSETLDSLTRSPLLPPERESGLRRIRQNPQNGSRNPVSPALQPISPGPSSPTSRKSSLNTFPNAGAAGISFGEDLTRFSSESLHSFSFAHRTSDPHARHNAILKRSIDFMRDKLGPASVPRIINAQARLTGDEEVLHMMELLQKANILGLQPSRDNEQSFDPGPLTGPAHLANENVFEQTFMAIAEETESPTTISAPNVSENAWEQSLGVRSMSASSRENLSRSRPSSVLMSRPVSSIEQRAGNSNEDRGLLSLSSPDERPQRATLKRTYTDIAGYSMQHKLAEAMAQPYNARQSHHANTLRNPVRAATITERAPHGDRNRHAQSQAVFTTQAEAPWTITSANDLACLTFGVTRAEVRKLGIMEMIQEDRRAWLEEKLKIPPMKPARLVPPPTSRKTSPSNSLAAIGNGVTAKLLSKPPARVTYQSRRSRAESEGGSSTTSSDANHVPTKSRGVLLCGDVVPIRKMDGSAGSASLWVKEKGNNLIWVLEVIAEDVAMLTVDEIGLVLKGSGHIEAIFGIDRVRNGMDVQRLIPAWPKLSGTNTGAVDYDAIARLRRFTARTSNSISIPITVDQTTQENQFRISSLPHIAGIIVVNPATMRITSSNHVFAGALFGHDSPNGLPIDELIPSFDNILQVMVDEDDVALVDGMVIPEHSFRRARSLLAVREGSAGAAAAFLRPSGLPAKHRDGAEIMIDVQMRVVKSDREGADDESAIDEDTVVNSASSELVYALWITYSRQLHAVNHGIGPVSAMISRPATPPHQPLPLSPNVDEVEPTPMVFGEGSDEDPRITLLTQQLEASKAAELAMSPSGSEPFEHPSPHLLDVGVETVSKKRIDDFTVLEDMGQGAYGQVKLARYKAPAAQKMCIKYVTKRLILVDTWHRDRRLGTVPLEIHVLDYLRRDGRQHPNIVEMADFFEDDVNYYIEMIPHGIGGMDLFDRIEIDMDMMNEAAGRHIFRQVAEAVRHLHVTCKVVHRDIKDENVILDTEDNVKLVDFGSAAYVKSGPFDVFVGTIDYAAPEVLRGEKYNGKEQDVWALGILLYTIIYKENPFYNVDEIMDHDLRVPYVTSEECIDLIRKMLDRDVRARIGIEGVLEHPWCTRVDPPGARKVGGKRAETEA